jgi:hypothetical protein
MVAGNHYHPNAGTLTLSDCIGYFSTQRVGQRDQSPPLKVKSLLMLRPWYSAAMQSTCHTQHAQTAICHRSRLSGDLIA